MLHIVAFGFRLAKPAKHARLRSLAVRIVVIGAGGVGGFLAALLARAGHEVGIVARGSHLSAIRESGLRLHSQQFGDMTVTPAASDDPADLPGADLVILGVKMYDFPDAARAAARVLKPDGAGLTIQNGLDAPDLLARVTGPRRVLIGTASIEATIVEPGVIGHLVPIHRLTISEHEGGPTPRLEQLESTLKQAEIDVSIAADGQQALWDKAAGLIPIATMTAAVSAGVGPIFQLDETRTVFQELMSEAGKVASASGHPVEAAQAAFMALMEQASKVRPDFTTSMERDFQKRKRTELEWLTGALVRKADEHHVAVPVHRVLYAVLKLRETRNMVPAIQAVASQV